MKTTAEIIAVMQAHEDGKEIEYRNGYYPTWKRTPNPLWDWSTTDYRVKPEEYIPFAFEDAEFLIGKLVMHKTAIYNNYSFQATNMGGYKNYWKITLLLMAHHSEN